MVYGNYRLEALLVNLIGRASEISRKNYTQITSPLFFPLFLFYCYWVMLCVVTTTSAHIYVHSMNKNKWNEWMWALLAMNVKMIYDNHKRCWKKIGNIASSFPQNKSYFALLNLLIHLQVIATNYDDDNQWCEIAISRPFLLTLRKKTPHVGWVRNV